MIPHQCVLCLGAGVKMLIEDLNWSVLAPKLAKLSSFLKLVNGIFLFAVEGSAISNDVLSQESCVFKSSAKLNCCKNLLVGFDSEQSRK